MRFTLNGEQFELTADDVQDRVRHIRPEPVREYGVQIGSVRYPVKQAFEAATGVSRRMFTTQVARRKLAALGFEIMATSRPPGEVPRAASGRIFICYRREDSGYPAGWLFDQLAAHFGVERVFKDVDSIEPGDDFAEVISKAVESCAVLLAVIGDRWLAVADEHGRRLDDPDDFVRLEIEAALARGMRVIPVLVGGARMPRPEQLPASLGPLARRQAIELSHAHFGSDIASLLSTLDRALGPATARQPTFERTSSARTGGAPKAQAVQQDAVGALPAPIIRFQDDDLGFLQWRANKPDCFFLNTERKPGPGYLMLHRSNCPHFTGSPLHWTKDYIKFCSPDLAALENWATRTIGDVKYCRTCFHNLPSDVDITAKVR